MNSSRKTCSFPPQKSVCKIFSLRFLSCEVKRLFKRDKFCSVLFACLSFDFEKNELGLSECLTIAGFLSALPVDLPTGFQLVVAWKTAVDIVDVDVVDQEMADESST